MDLPVEYAHARLPANYEAAKQAIASLVQIDECQNWADKAAAMASYAKQANDLELEDYARRVRLRALQRCGELIKAVPTARGANQNFIPGNGNKVTGRWETAQNAGLSKRQVETAMNLANIPAEQFEQHVERTPAPTIAEMQALIEKNYSSNLPPYEGPKRCPTCGEIIRQRLTE